RIGIYAIMSSMHSIEKMGLGVSEVDKLTGTVIGRAKSATFRTLDLVGLDTTVNVANQLYGILEKDESRDTFRLPGIVEKLYNNNWLGEKTGQGFFKMIRHKDGSKELKEIDLKTLEYKDAEKPKFKALDDSKEIDD